MTPEAFRAHFPIFAERVHLCSCSEGAASHEALAALTTFARSWAERGAPWDAWMQQVEMARLKFARLIGARETEVAVVPSASVGAYLAVAGLTFDAARPTIVTSDLEFPSLAHVWLAQQVRGARVRHVRHQEGVIPLEIWQQAIGPDTKLVSAFHVSYANGARNDLAAVGRAAHAAGALFFVDAYQGAGVVPLDVKAIDADFLVAGTLKYLLGTPGLAFLYVREELAETLQPSLTGWLGQAHPFAFNPFVLDHAPGALRFQTGTPAVAAAFTANAGLDLILAAKPTVIWSHVQNLSTLLTERLLEAGWPLFSPLAPDLRGPQVAVFVDHPEAMAQTLAERGLLVSPRGPVIRISLHYYNDTSDVETLVTALSQLR